MNMLDRLREILGGKRSLLQPMALTFFAFVVIFQIYLVSQARVFYQLLKIPFLILIVLSVLALIKASRTNKLALFLILAVFIIRVPFLVHAPGVMMTSDNAVEALQVQEIQDSHRAPFFLLESLRHIGTIKYLVVAWLWDACGAHYVFYLLVQMIVFSAFLLLLGEVLKPFIGKPALAILLVGQFAFIETVFDYSLSIRGGPYLEMITVFMIGAALYDWNRPGSGRNALAFYFVFGSVYLHPIGAIFAVAFVLCAFLLSLRRGRWLAGLLSAAAGCALALFHVAYYIFFYAPKAPPAGAWEEIRHLPWTNLSFGAILEFFKRLVVIFQNLFNFELTYHAAAYHRGAILVVLNKILVIASGSVLVAASVLALIKVIRYWRKKEKSEGAVWIYLFFLVLFGCFAAKTMMMDPVHAEPRHNFDLLVLVILSFAFVVPFLQIPRLKSFRAVAVAGMLGLFLVPHYSFYLDESKSKQQSYEALMRVLTKYRVRAVDTDFNLAYIVYFRSHRRILVSDSLGPVTVSAFYPRMGEEVDRIPNSQKAYILYSPQYPLSGFSKTEAAFTRRRVFERMKADQVRCRTVELKDYTVVIPIASEEIPKPPEDDAGFRAADFNLSKPGGRATWNVDVALRGFATLDAGLDILGKSIKSFVLSSRGRSDQARGRRARLIGIDGAAARDGEEIIRWIP